MFRWKLPFVLAVSAPWWVVSTGSLCADDDFAKLAVQGTAIVKKHCYQCHGETFNGSAQLNVMDRDGLLEHGYVLPDQVEESPIWQRVSDDEMPPQEAGILPLTDDEKRLLKRWLAAGAPQVQRQKRGFKSYRDVIVDIHADLMNTAPADRHFLRYFSLAHLSNNYQGVSEHSLRLYRAAFSKAINSLSQEPTIYVPETVDAEETIFRVDMRRLGWNAKLWKNAILAHYPYGFHFENGSDRQVATMDEQMDQLAGTELCWLRVDWFINHATRPPIYNMFLDIPTQVATLEERLNVNFPRNFTQNRLVRGGFATSGVSTGNRLVERHAARDGYYWKSYDFKRAGVANNLFRFPLGPQFDENEHNLLAFQHDGGEMIFSLPNGLQGYMLSDAKGKRIAKGPIAVVRDSKEIGGTPEVVNGLSCIHCHRHGMITFRDTVRNGNAVLGLAKRKVEELYPHSDDMDQVVRKDREMFLHALEAAIGPFLQVDEDAAKPITDFAEPIGAIARYYQRDLTLETVACELGLENVEALKQGIRHNPEMLRLGLGPLASGHTIKRAFWENTDALVSPFQQVMTTLRLATPTNPVINLDSSH